MGTIYGNVSYGSSQRLHRDWVTEMRTMNTIDLYGKLEQSPAVHVVACSRPALRPTWNLVPVLIAIKYHEWKAEDDED